MKRDREEQLEKKRQGGETGGKGQRGRGRGEETEGKRQRGET